MNIALIEDSEIFRHLFIIYAKDLGLSNISEFSNLEKFKQSQINFDLVFTDLNLPDAWGHDTVNHIRQKNKSCYLVVVTALAGQYFTGTIAAELIKSGANEAISKDDLNPKKLSFILQNANSYLGNHKNESQL
jgi:DNA-binding NarL/FixJ family response regulator